MGDSEIYCISSDEEDINPPKPKKLKLCPEIILPNEATVALPPRKYGLNSQIKISMVEKTKFNGLEAKNNNTMEAKKVNGEVSVDKTTMDQIDPLEISAIDDSEPQDSLLKVIGEEKLDATPKHEAPSSSNNSPENSAPDEDSAVHYDSEDETRTEGGDLELSSHCSTNLQSDASCSTLIPKLPIELEALLNLCKKNVQSTNITKKLKSVRAAAHRASAYLASKRFADDLETFRNEILREPKRTAHVFVQLYNRFKENEDANAGEDRKTYKIEKLYATLKKVQEVIAKLGEEDANLEAEENSNYMKYQRYNEQADKILKKIGELEKVNPYHNIMYFSRLDFSRSRYNEFNTALNSKYKNRHKHTFPTFFEVNKLLRTCAREKNMNLSENVLREHIEYCFEELGKLLKLRRQKDLEFIHSTHVPNHSDPAKSDPQLEQKLRANRKCARTKMEEIFKKFTLMQDTDVNPSLSEDSDDSKHQESDEDDD